MAGGILLAAITVICFGAALCAWIADKIPDEWVNKVAGIRKVPRGGRNANGARGN